MHCNTLPFILILFIFPTDTMRANVTLADLVPEKEIKTTSTPNCISDDSSDDDDDDVDIDQLLEDASEDQVAALRNKIDDALKDEIATRWSRKKVVKSSMHKPPGYDVNQTIL